MEKWWVPIMFSLGVIAAGMTDLVMIHPAHSTELHPLFGCGDNPTGLWLRSVKVRKSRKSVKRLTIEGFQVQGSKKGQVK